MISSTSTSGCACGGLFDLDLIDERDGLIVFRASGKNAEDAFAHEPGGHRWQRVPPTEKRGRRQTSTITVAVLPEAKKADVDIDDQDLEWRTTHGSSKGGQHANKNDTCIQLKHLPTGLLVKASGRSQSDNRERALAVLRTRLLEDERKKNSEARKQDRKSQVGSGMRGDKVRTIRVHDNIVTHHLSGKKIPYDRYLKGDFEGLV